MMYEKVVIEKELWGRLVPILFESWALDAIFTKMEGNS